MEDSFEKLKKDGANNIDNLVQWIKDSKLVEQSKEAEDSAKKLFDKVQDKKNVLYSEFIEVVTKLAENQKKSLEDYSKMLSEGLPKLQEALTAAAAVFQETMSKK